MEERGAEYQTLDHRAVGSRILLCSTSIPGGVSGPGSLVAGRENVYPRTAQPSLVARLAADCDRSGEPLSLLSSGSCQSTTPCKEH